VELVDSESIVARGTRKVTWLVRVADAWARPDEQPGATTQERDAGPGTVWERAVTVPLPVGCRVMRIESRPYPQQHVDPLEYLRRDVRQTRRRTHRQEYRVTARGALERISPPTRQG
jgi:hypothetical protein